MPIHEYLVKLQRDQEDALIVTFHRTLKEIVDRDVPWIADIGDIIHSVVDSMVPTQPRPTATMWLAWDMPDPGRYDIELEHNADIEKRMRVGLYLKFQDFLNDYDCSGVSAMAHESTLLELEDSIELRDLKNATVYDTGDNQFGVTRA